VKTVSVVLGSILLGVLSHVLWDSFTHDGGWAVERLQVLRHPIYLPLTGARPLHKILQLLSSLLGTLWLVTWCVLWFLRTNVGDPTSSEFLESKAKSLRYPVFGLAVLAGLVSAVAKHAEFNDVSGLPWLLGRSLMTSSAVFLLVVLIIGLIWRTKGITQKAQELASVHRLSR
jgi:preprotein translocase subunit SecG